MNILFCSVGRRAELIKDFKQSMQGQGCIVAVDCSPLAPALYLADKYYIVPRIDDPDYLDIILDICNKEGINAVTTFIDPEIELLAKNRKIFEDNNILVLTPEERTAEICFDKYKMYKYLKDNNINTVMTWSNIEEFLLDSSRAAFPVFVKPRFGSGSVGARKINDIDELKIAYDEDPTLIIQELMNCEDLDADVYIDTISKKAVSAFSKKKLSTTIGGANKTISFKDERLFQFIKEICSIFEFNGPVDMDFFYSDGAYYLSEINPRFGGGYLHAYGAGVDFIKMIINNVRGIENEPNFGCYDDNVVMMMYDSVVITKDNNIIFR